MSIAEWKKLVLARFPSARFFRNPAGQNFAYAKRRSSEPESEVGRFSLGVPWWVALKEIA